MECPNILESITQNRVEREGSRRAFLQGRPREWAPAPRAPALGHHPPLCPTVGKPIKVQKILHPSEEEVDKLHEHYIKELCNLFEAHKLKYNVPMDQHLEFC